MSARRHRLAARRRAAGHSQESLAAALGVDRCTVQRWESGASTPQPTLRRGLAATLGVDDNELTDLLLGSRPATEQSIGDTPEETRDGDPAALLVLAGEESGQWAQWAELSNTGPFALEQLHTDLRTLARAYLDQPPVSVFLAVREARDRAFRLLEGHQRPTQTRELYAMAGYSCALLAWISGDLGRSDAADVHSRTAWLCADFADTPELQAWILATRSKTAYWRGQFREAIDWAKQGEDYAPSTTVKVLLTCQQADAWSELGAPQEARLSLNRAEQTRNQISGTDQLGGLLSFGHARQANYAAGVHLRLQETARALEAASAAFEAYDAGEHRSHGTIAQLHITQALSHLHANDLDGVEHALGQVLNAPASLHLETVGQRLATVSTGLAPLSRQGGLRATAIRGEIEDYRANSAGRELTA